MEECSANINVLIKCDKAVKTGVQNLLADLWNRIINLSSQFFANNATVSWFYAFLEEAEAESQIYFWEQQSQYFNLCYLERYWEMSQMSHQWESPTQARNKIKAVHFEEVS